MQKLRKLENIHIALWLLKDTCWVMDFKLAGVAMIFPTISLALYITWKYRKIVSELFHNLAVCMWILANSTWMFGEFFYDDTTRPYAAFFFFSGLFIVGFYYIFLSRRNEAILEVSIKNEAAPATQVEAMLPETNV